MSRLLALCLVLLLPLGALARESDCVAACENDQKNCEVQCGKKVGKNKAPCKSACAELTEPCHDACKKKEGKRK